MSKRRVLARGLLAAALLALATGCSSSPTPTATPTLAADGSIPTENQAASDQTPVPWVLQKVDQSTNRIYLTLNTQDCSNPQAALVTETTTEVTITGLGNTFDPSVPCAATDIIISGFITTAAPIGNRKILHGR
ncbi:MAG: hypothetical protein M3Y77_14760 [Actinomycetota bacterium]|nr:hypothetical protein [Actinomycetota bacterium]